MSDKIILNNFASFQNDATAVALANANNTLLTHAMDNTLSLDGTAPNQMQSNLDMNSNQILNLPSPATTRSPARLIDVVSNPSITVPPVGTSGATVPLLNANNTWSGSNTFKQTDTYLNVVQFGADPTGVADSAPAIQNAINALPINGGIIFFPVGAYRINSTINIGNGTSSLASTRSGVVLLGAGMTSAAAIFGGYQQNIGAKLFWGGVSNGTMISINGPLQGWGIQNMSLDALSVASIGILVTSAQFGDCCNLSISGCQAQAIFSTTVGTFGAFETDSLHNSWRNITIEVPLVFAAMGILLTGSNTLTSNTDYNHFSNIAIALPNTTCYGVFLQACDSNEFYNLHIFGGGASAKAVNFDYTINSAWPASNMFFGVDSGTNQWASTTPGSLARPNYVYGLGETNGMVNLNLTNINPALPLVVSPGIDLTGQTASIGAQNVMQNFYRTGMYRISLYLEVTTPGSGGTVLAQLFWTDDSGAVQAINSATINLNAKNYTTLNIPVRITNTPAVTTTVSGATGGPVYALHVRLEKLD